MKKGQFKLILSKEFIRVLKNINDSISKKLLFLNNNSDYGYPISYINITTEDNYISFTPSKKVLSLDGSIPRSEMWSSNRNKQKIGRFVSQMIIEDPKKVENFVNKFRSEIKSLNNLDNFEIVSGYDISQFYLEKYYSRGGGSLNKSCMRHDKCQDYLKFYNINPDKVNLIVLYDSNKKTILGRSLLWKVDEPNIQLMDRVYSTVDSDQNLFIKLAKKNGWYYKKSQSFNESRIIDDKGKEVTLNGKVFLKKEEHRYFPYLDTFYFYDKEKCYITNDIEEYQNNKNIVKLRSTDGRDQGNVHFVFDIYNNDHVRTRDTVHCEIDDSRILKNDVIQVEGYNTSPNNIRFSEYDGKVYLKENVVWSTTHGTFINKKRSFVVQFDRKGKKIDYIHSDLKGEQFDYVNNKDSYFIKELIIKGIDGKLYLKDEYNEDEIKSKVKGRNRFDTVVELNSYFDEFIKKISDKKNFNIEYGTFGSTHDYDGF